MVWNSSASMLEIWVCSLAFNRVQVVVSDENLNLRLIPLIVIASSLLFQLCFSTVREKEAAESESLNLYLCNKKDCKRIYEWPCKKSRVSKLGLGEQKRFRHRLDQWPQPTIKSNAALPFCFLISTLSLFAALLCLATGSATLCLAPRSNPFINRNSMSRENASDTPRNSYFEFVREIPKERIFHVN